MTRRISFKAVQKAAAKVVFDAIIEHDETVTYQDMYPEHENTGANGCWYGSNSHHEERRPELMEYRGAPIGSPACIVGRILAALGLTKYISEGKDAREVVYRIPATRFSSPATREDVAEFLAGLQFHQDSGESWAKSFAYAMSTG